MSHQFNKVQYQINRFRFRILSSSNKLLSYFFISLRKNSVIISACLRKQFEFHILTFMIARAKYLMPNWLQLFTLPYLKKGFHTFK
jgi:hypothetical protein